MQPATRLPIDDRAAGDESGQSAAPAPAAGGRAPTSFRANVEGLRAVAIVLVVLYHAGVPRITGGYVGVDVFFVISGFVITLTLTRELASKRRLSIARFYARRVTRLLPAASVVIIATLAASWLWLPPLLVRGIGKDALACTLYFINYRLAFVGVDYFAGDSPSPFQHFWSLAVEEQFYFVWPLLLATLMVGWGVARRRRPRTGLTVTALVVIIAASFAFCVWLTRESLPWAYFNAGTRAWELGLGALVAVGAGWLARVPARLSAGLTWLGLAAVVGSALWYTDATPFPGSAALLPVAGTALVIAGGCAAPRGGAETVLRTPVFQGIGKISYSWYLWHWPVFVIAPVLIVGEDGTLRLRQRLLLAAASLVLAVVSYRYLENPIRTARKLKAMPWRAIALGGSLSAVTAVVAVVVALLFPLPVGGAPVKDLAGSIGEPTQSPGVRPMPLAPAQLAIFRQELSDAITAGLQVRTVPSNLTPALPDAASDAARIYPDGCDPGYARIDVRVPCEYGDTSSATTIVLFGDSHAGQWFPPLEAIATKYHWKLLVVTKSACTPADVPIYSGRLKREYTECDQWRTNSVARIKALHPAMVVFASRDGSSLLPGDQPQVWAGGWRSTMDAIKATGTRLVLISDTPQPKTDAPLCVSAHLTNVRLCNSTVANAFPALAERRAVAVMAAADGVTVVDPTPWFCVAGQCPVIVGNILVYKDTNHMTTPYANLLTPVLESAIVPT